MIAGEINPSYDFKSKKEELIKEKLNIGEYTSEDVAIVRTCNHLNDEHSVESISNIPFVTSTNNLASSAVYQVLNDKLHPNIFNEEEYDAFRKQVYDNSPLSTQYRSTVHFCLNGLVSSHSKGDFDNRKFIIIDSLTSHVDKGNLASFRPEDTFFRGNVELSNKSVVLVKKDRYDELLSDNPSLSSYNVVLYNDEQSKAVDDYLTSIGIVGESVLTDNIEQSQTSPLLEKYGEKLNEKLNVSLEKHFYSQEYREDDEKNIQLWQYYDNLFYTYLFDKISLTEEQKEEYLNVFYNADSTDAEAIDLYVFLINNIGLDNYCELVQKYNIALKESVKTGELPTNNQILDTIEKTSNKEI